MWSPEFWLIGTASVVLILSSQLKTETEVLAGVWEDFKTGNKVNQESTPQSSGKAVMKIGQLSYEGKHPHLIKDLGY